jgi:heme-degrading monooxygenase HmoA
VIAVIFEVFPRPELKGSYYDITAELRPLLEQIDGFISVERFQSLTDEGKILSLSFWRDEAAIREWRNLELHRKAQAVGREKIFQQYRLRVASVIRDYGLLDREQAPDAGAAVGTD